MKLPLYIAYHHLRKKSSIPFAIFPPELSHAPLHSSSVLPGALDLGVAILSPSPVPSPTPQSRTMLVPALPRPLHFSPPNTLCSALHPFLWVVPGSFPISSESCVASHVSCKHPEITRCPRLKPLFLTADRPKFSMSHLTDPAL